MSFDKEHLFSEILPFLINKKLLQTFLQGGGFILCSPPKFFSAKKFVLYFQKKINDNYFLEIDFGDVPLINANNDTFSYELKQMSCPKLDSQNYKVTTSLIEPFVLKSVCVCYQYVDKPDESGFHYINDLIFKSELEIIIIISRDESPGSFEVRFGSDDLIDKIKKASVKYIEIN